MIQQNEERPSSNQGLKNLASRGMFWSALDKIGVQVGQLIVGVVLANLLSPDDFGLIGMLSIFLAISQTFVDCGMEKGLVQKHDRSEIDFSTVFIFNFFASLVIYILLFVCSPAIASFYDRPELTQICRVLSLIIIINSLAIVQRAKLTIAVDFKIFAKARVIAFTIGGGLAIYLAQCGFGVWSIVWQILVTSVITTVLFWLWSHWRPSVHFSNESFVYLWKYGYRILLSGLYGQGMINAYNLVIGKFYSPIQLGFYTNARKYAEVSSASISGVLQQVTFPILAALQNDSERLTSVYRRIVRMTVFATVPTMMLIAMLADPIVRVLLKDEWYPMIPLLRIMCLVTVFYPVSVLNLNVLNAVGRSDLFLRTNLIKSPIMIGSLLITIPLGVQAIVIGQAVASLLGFCVNTYYPGKLFGYGLKEHLWDSLPFLIGTGIMSFAVLITNSLVSDAYLQLVLGGGAAIASYVGFAGLMQFDELSEAKALLRRVARRQ